MLLQRASESYPSSMVSTGTVSNLLKRKKEIEEQYEENVSVERIRKNREINHDQLNKLMWVFFQSCRQKNIPVSGPMLKEQALVYAKQLSDEDFKASNGWLECDPNLCLVSLSDLG